MIEYKKTTFKDFTGEWQAEITSVDVEPNQFFRPEEDNSTENVLNIGFELIDPNTWDRTPFTQKYVNPLTFGNGLFQQLLDVYGFGPEEDGGEFDEQNFVGMKLIVNIVKNKKGYATIESVKAAPAKGKPTQKPQEEKEVDDDLPFPPDPVKN